MADTETTTPEAEPLVEGVPAGEAGAGDAPEADPESFTPEYVHKLRDEAAGFRTELNPYKETFDGFADEEREAFLDLARTLKSDPIAAADWMEQVAKNIKQGMAPEAAEEKATVDVAEKIIDDADKPLTRKEWERLTAEREQTQTETQQRQSAIDAVESEIRALGVDPDSADGIAVMQAAYSKTGGDIPAAYKLAIEDRNQAIIDAYVAAKAADAEGVGAGVQGGTASGEREVKTLKDAAAAMRERLDAIG